MTTRLRLATAPIKQATERWHLWLFFALLAAAPRFSKAAHPA